MDSVNLKVSDLLTKLQANRTKHETDYKEAMEGYKSEVISKLEETISTLTAELDAAKAGDTGKVDHIGWLGLTKPEEHLEDYDQVITMLEMSVDETVELVESDFTRYVMDRWRWRQQFETSNLRYKGK